METYRIRLRIHSGTLTPFQADTVFGHLCWIVARREGERGLEEFLRPFREEDPPFLISDGFSGDLLPKPLSAEINIDDPSERKEMKRLEFMNLVDFEAARLGKKTKPLFRETHVTTLRTLHSAISRDTQRTLSEGGLYSLEETHVPAITIYIKTVSEAWETRVVDLFRELS